MPEIQFIRRLHVFQLAVAVCVFSCLSCLVSCNDATTSSLEQGTESPSNTMYTGIIVPDSSHYFHLLHDVRMRHYFSFMDSLLLKDDYAVLHGVNEYTLLWSNPWILDSLVSYDYYTRSERGEFIADQKNVVILQAGDSLLIPDSIRVKGIEDWLAEMRLDLNIPEYRLCIYNADSLLHIIPVRVGKNSKRYLALAHHEVDLRTPVGEGEIIRIERSPLYIDPVTGHRYKSTRRDDGLYTALPQIPFLEPIIAGERHGSLLHPTTNLSTLGKAVSNGCVGMRESDAWLVYYHAPLHTPVTFRYDMDPRRNGELLPDIYAFGKKH